MSAIFHLMVLPVTALNLFGGIIGMVWLVMLGQWMLLAFGLAALVISSIWLRWALAPGLLLSGPGLALAGKRYYVWGGFLILMGEAWTYAVMFTWCLAAYFTGISAWNSNPGEPIYPFLLWIYGTATAPFTYEATVNPESLGSFMGALAACAGVIAVMGLAVLRMDTIEAVMAALIVPMIPALIVQAILYAEMTRARAFDL